MGSALGGWGCSRDGANQDGRGVDVGESAELLLVVLSLHTRATGEECCHQHCLWFTIEEAR